MNPTTDPQGSEPPAETPSVAPIVSTGKASAVVPPGPAAPPPTVGTTGPAPADPREPAPLLSKLAVQAASAPPAAPPTPTTADLMLPVPSHPPSRPPDDGRTDPALVELTIGFEVVSLQLTPSFQVGALQLRSVSNVVSVHLGGSQNESPRLAAGISFQIERAGLDEAAHLESLQLKPLGEFREATPPRASLQIDHVAVTTLDRGPAIAVAASTDAVAATVQLFASFTVAEIELTPAFDVGSLRLVPASRAVRVRVSPSSLANARDLPLAFEIEEVTVADDAQTLGVRLVPVPGRGV